MSLGQLGQHQNARGDNLFRLVHLFTPLARGYRITRLPWPDPVDKVGLQNRIQFGEDRKGETGEPGETVDAMRERGQEL